MKTLIFIVLKIVEIALIPIIYLGVCYAGYYAFEFMDLMAGVDEPTMLKTGADFYLGCPLILIFVLGVTFLFGVLIYNVIPDWIEANKEWSNNIYNKLRK